jgi:hypothetical protein
VRGDAPWQPNKNAIQMLCTPAMYCYRRKLPSKANCKVLPDSSQSSMYLAPTVTADSPSAWSQQSKSSQCARDCGCTHQLHVRVHTHMSAHTTHNRSSREQGTLELCCATAC